jgi:hypothetical protein
MKGSEITKKEVGRKLKVKREDENMHNYYFIIFAHKFSPQLS